MELHCIRHATTIENLKGIYQGRADGTVIDEQLAALALLRFDATRFDAIHVSPLARCRDTARALGIVGWSPEPRLAERDLGIFEGLTPAECAAQHADAFRAFLAFDADFRIPNGESRAQHLARTREWLRDVARHARVLAITHGGTIDFLYRMARGIDLHGGEKIFSASNASLSRFDVRGTDVVLLGYDEPLA